MKTMGLSTARSIAAFTLTLSCTASVVGCADFAGSNRSSGGVITLSADQGIVFSSEEVLSGDKFNQVDLLATENGDRLRLAAGGETTTKPNPVNWFPADQGLYQMFSGLADVPADKPQETNGVSMLKTTSGYGFVLKNFASGGYTKGWIRSSSASEDVIEYELIE